MARGKKHKRKPRGIVETARAYFGFDEEDEISQAELSRAARSHLHETIGEANLPSYNDTYKPQIEGQQPGYQGQRGYVPEGQFNYDAEHQPSIITFTDTAHPANPRNKRVSLPKDFNQRGFADYAQPDKQNIAEYFLVSYEGNSRSVTDTDTYTIPDIPYCAATSIRAKEMRAELAVKIARFENALQEDIEAGVTQERLATAKAGFMDEIDDYLNDCEAEIKNRGPLPPGKEPKDGIVTALAKAAYYSSAEKAYEQERYNFEAFKHSLSQHLDHKLENTRVLANQFQLWDPAQLKFNDKSTDSLATGDEKKYFNALTKIKKDHDVALFDKLNSLDNDPHLVLDIKKLEADTKKKLDECLASAANDKVTITITHPELKAAVSTNLADSASDSVVATTERTEPLREYLKSHLPALTQKAVELRSEMNGQFKTPKSRLQQWRFEYDRDHATQYDEALNKRHADFTQASAEALKKIQALTPADTVAKSESFDIEISRTPINALTDTPDSNTAAAPITNLASIHQAYKKFTENNGVVREPTATEIAANPTKKTEYETYLAGPIPGERLKTLQNLEQQGNDLRTELRAKLTKPIEPKSPHFDKNSTAAEHKSYNDACIAYRRDIAIYKAYQLSNKAPDKPIVNDPSNLTVAEQATEAQYQTELTAYQAPLKTELDQLNKIQAFYHPEDTAKPDGNSFAQFSTQYQTLSDEVDALQKKYQDAARKFVDIEFRWNPAQATTDLAQLKADYEQQFKDQTAKLDALNKEVQKFKSTTTDHAIQAEISSSQKVFAEQIAALTTAQKNAFEKIATAAEEAREAADKACQQYNLQYRVYCLQNGPIAGPLTEAQKKEIKDSKPAELLQNLNPEPLLDQRLKLGLVSVRANKNAKGETGYQIELTDTLSLGAAKNRNSDGSFNNYAVCSYLWSKKSRSEEIRATLTNPEKLDDVGLAIDLIIAARDPKDAGKPLSTCYPAYNKDNYNTMLAISMASIARGVPFDAEKDFDQSFQGAVYEHDGAKHVTGILDGPKRKQVRAEYLKTIAAYREQFEKAQAFNNVCREVLDGRLKPGSAPATLHPETANMRLPQKLFVQAITTFSYQDNTTAAQLTTPGADKRQILANSIQSLKHIDLSTVKGLVPDGAGNRGNSAALMGMVLDRRSAAEILALKERELCSIYNELRTNKTLSKDPKDPLYLQADALRKTLNQDYHHITRLADNQGLNAPEFKQQHALALRRINAAAYGTSIDPRAPKTEAEADFPGRVRNFIFGEEATPSYGENMPEVARTLNVDELRARGYGAEKALEGKGFNDIIAKSKKTTDSTGKITPATPVTTLLHLAKLHSAILSGRELNTHKSDTVLDTDFTKKALANIEQYATDPDLATKSKAAVDELEASKKGITDPAALADIEKKIAATKEIAILLTEARPVIEANHKEIKDARDAFNKIQASNLVTTKAPDWAALFKQRLEGLQTLDQNLNALKDLLPSQHQARCNLGDEIRVKRKFYIGLLNQKVEILLASPTTIASDKVRAEAIPSQEAKLKKLEKTLDSTTEESKKGRLQSQIKDLQQDIANRKPLTIDDQLARLKSAQEALRYAAKNQTLRPAGQLTPEEGTRIDTNLTKLSATIALFTALKTAQAAMPSLADPKKATQQKKIDFYKAAEALTKNLNAVEQDVKNNSLASPAHKKQLTDAIADERATLIANATAISAKYATNLPNKEELEAAEAFVATADLHRPIVPIEGMDENIVKAREQFDITANKIEEANTHEQIILKRILLTTTYQEVHTEDKKLEELIKSLEGRQYDSLSSPEQQEKITDAVTELKKQKTAVTQWIKTQEAIFEDSAARVHAMPIGSSDGRVPNEQFYCDAATKIAALDKVKAEINASTTISPTKKSELLGNIQGAKDKLINAATTVSEGYTAVIPSDTERAAAKAFVTAAGLPNSFIPAIGRNEITKNVNAAEATIQTTQTLIDNAGRTIDKMDPKSTDDFTKLDENVRTVEKLTTDLAARNDPKTASPSQQAEIVAQLTAIDSKKPLIIQEAQIKASDLLTNPHATVDELAKAQTFFVDHEPEALTAPAVASGAVASGAVASGAVAQARAAAAAAHAPEKIVDACDKEIEKRSAILPDGTELQAVNHVNNSP